MSIVIKSLLPSVMMTGFPTVSTTIPKETQQIRKRTLVFLESLVQASDIDEPENHHMEINDTGLDQEHALEAEMTKQEKAEFEKRNRAQARQISHSVAGHNALQLLIQHICMEIPEKAEYRHAAHATIADLMAKLYTIPVVGKASEQQHAPRFISFLLKYGRHKKPIFRLFATEVAEELLLHPTFTNPVTLSTIVQKVNKKSKKKSQHRKEALKSLDIENGDLLEKLDLGVSDTTMDITESEDKHAEEAIAEEGPTTAKEPTVVFSFADHLEMLCHLAQFLLERSSDKIVNVRAKALASIATTLERAAGLKESILETTSQPHLLQAIAKVYFGNTAVSTSSTTEPVLSSELTQTTPQKTSCSAGVARSPSIFKTPEPKLLPIAPTFSLVNLVTKRLEDERSTVRRGALQLLEMVCRYDSLSASTSNTLHMFKNACFDPLLIIRKQASVSLTNLLAQFPSHELLMATWVQSVPVLAFDAELTVQEASVKSFVELVLLRLLNTSNKKTGIDFAADPGAWQLFEMVTSCGSDTTGKVIGKLCQMIAQSADYLALAKKFASLLGRAVTFLSKPTEKPLATSEGEHIKLEERRKNLELACWKALSMLSLNTTVTSHVDQDSVYLVWNEIKDDLDVSMETKHLMVNTLGALVNGLSAKQVGEISRDLSGRLKTFRVPPSIVQSSVHLLVKLTDREYDQQPKTSAQNANLKWMTDLVSSAESKLADIVIPSDQGETSSSFSSFEALDSILFTVGEIAQVLPKNRVPGRIVTLLQTFIANTFKGILVDPKTVPSSTIASADEASTSSAVLLPLPPATRALAFVSLGKLCLQDQTLAKTCIAAFARELEVSPSSIVRNNIMVVICDLVVRYSNLVDNYLCKLAICLRDESEMVRRQTLLMLTNLLQEEFIKIRQGHIFFPLVLTLVDESEVLRQFALLCIEGILSKQGGASHIFFSNFIETIFFLNDYRLHPTYNQFHYSARDRHIFNMSGGGANRTKRFTIYKIFFDHMEEQHKYQVSFKLCEEILQAVLDGQLPMQEAQHILYDVLCILSSEEIRLKNIGARAATKELDPDQLEDDINNAKADNQKKLAEATGQLAAQVVKRTMIERIVPIMIELKNLLAKHHSPLLKNVMNYLSDLVKDMPEEMAEVLEHNRQLAMELAYETRLSKAIKASRKPKNADAGLDDDEDADAMDDHEEVKKGKKAPRPKPASAARSGLSLASAAGAPTPWKRAAPEVAEFAVPKLRTGTTPYKPSPARAHVSTDDDGTLASSSAIAAAAAANALTNAGGATPRSLPAAVIATPQTPKTSKPASLSMAPPSTPGDISSPLVARMRHAAIVIKTPSSGNKARVLEDGSVEPHADVAADVASSEEGGSRNAKRPRYLDSDGDNFHEHNSVSSSSSKGKRDVEPSSPMAKKPRPKRPKTSETPTSDQQSAVVASSSTVAPPELAPAPTRPKRTR
jgi:condensin-2 complex subunit D3